MSKPISLAYRGRGGSTAESPVSQPGTSQKSTAVIAAGLDKLVKDGLDWDQLAPLAAVEDVEETFDGFRPVRGGTGSYKDKNGVWHRTGAISFIASKVSPPIGGKTFIIDSIVEAILPVGCTVDVPVGEDAKAGKLTIRHKRLAEGEKLFRLPDGDTSVLAQGHKLTMKPVVSCMFVDFDGLKPYRIEEKRVKLFSESDLARAEELGTLVLEDEVKDSSENPQG